MLEGRRMMRSFGAPSGMRCNCRSASCMAPAAVSRPVQKLANMSTTMKSAIAVAAFQALAADADAVLPPAQFATGKVQEFFQNRLDVTEHPYFEGIADLRVSAHFLIERDGTVTQFVSCRDRAWHAGISQFEGRDTCNDFSLGVELEGTDDQPFTDAQYVSLTNLTRQLLAAYPGITPQRICGHSDIAPGRKTDPGPHFAWTRYFNSVEKQNT